MALWASAARQDGGASPCTPYLEISHEFRFRPGAHRPFARSARRRARSRAGAARHEIPGQGGAEGALRWRATVPDGQCRRLRRRAVRRRDAVAAPHPAGARRAGRADPLQPEAAARQLSRHRTLHHRAGGGDQDQGHDHRPHVRCRSARGRHAADRVHRLLVGHRHQSDVGQECLGRGRRQFQQVRAASQGHRGAVGNAADAARPQRHRRISTPSWSIARAPTGSSSSSSTSSATVPA